MVARPISETLCVGFIACQILVRFTGQEFENVRKVTGRAAHSSGSHIPMDFILLARNVRIWNIKRFIQRMANRKIGEAKKNA